jgi:hypothetical protein
MRKFSAFILILFFVAISNLVDARSYEVKKRVGGYEAEVRLDRNPPVLGDNPIEIEIRDERGRNVTDAKVLVNYYMPPMPRMAPMNYVTDGKLKGEKYKATMKFIMAGPWIIAIKIFRDGSSLSTKINVDAQ